MAQYPKHLKVAVYADGANKNDMLKRYKEGFVKGFTTNPSLVAKAGITDYETFARDVLKEIKDLSISFEVFSDELDEMETQARKIATWGKNVAVKIPITNTKKQSTLKLIRTLADANIKLNVTAIFTQDQLDGLRAMLKPTDDVIVSIFAGRISDTGIDPIPLMSRAVKDYASLKGSKILWASTRETLNIYQADQCGCQIITATDAQIANLQLYGKSLEEYSLDTVKTFYKDATAAGFKI